MGFPVGAVAKGSACQYRRCRFSPWVGKIPLEEKMATHSRYSCLENSMDRGAWQATVHGVTKELDMTEHSCTHRILCPEVPFKNEVKVI